MYTSFSLIDRTVLKRKKGVLKKILVPIIILLVASSVISVQAQSFFEKTCPRCHGKGYIVKISRTDMDGDWAWTGSYWGWKVIGTFYNQGVEGGTKTVVAWSSLYQDGDPRYDENSGSYYFPANSYKTVSITVRPPPTSGQWWVSMYVVSPTTTCPECGGDGYVIDWGFAVPFAVIVGGVFLGVVFLAAKSSRTTKEEEPTAPSVEEPLPPPSAPPPGVRVEREILIRCQYCGGLYPQGILKCPHCGARAT